MPRFRVSTTEAPFESLAEALCARPCDGQGDIYKVREDGEEIWMAFATGPIYKRRWELTSNGIVEARKNSHT